MVKISYSVNIGINNNIDSVDVSENTNRIGRRLSSFTSSDSRTVKSGGWLSEPGMTASESEIIISPAIFCNEEGYVHTGLSGPIVTASDRLEIDSPEFSVLIDGQSCLAAEASGASMSTVAATFSRKNKKVFIDKLYTLVVPGSKSLEEFQFSRINVGDVDYFVFNEENPEPVSARNGSDVSIVAEDMLGLSLDYLSFIDTRGISQTQFYSMCEYFSAEDLGIAYIDPLSDLGYIDIKVSYFPIYSHAVAIIRTDLGAIQVPLDPETSINSIDGIIRIDASVLNSLSQAVDGIYVYYSIVPAVFINPVQQNIDLSKEARSTDSVTVWGINNNDSVSNIDIDTTVVNLYAWSQDGSDNHTSIVMAPERYKDIFLETEEGIYINGEYTPPGSVRMIDNSGSNFISLSAPSDIDKLTNVATVSGGVITMNANVAEGDVMIFGEFDYYSVKKLSLMTSTNIGMTQDMMSGSYPVSHSLSVDEVGILQDTGGPGAISSLEALTGSTAQSVLLQEMSITITPSVDGYEYTLPVWPDISTIAVVEIAGNMTEEVFSEWNLISPDVVVLSRAASKKSRSYRITFNPLVSFLAESHALVENAISVIIPEGLDLLSSHQNLVKIHYLSPKIFSIRIGYIDDSGDKVYLPNSLSIHQHIHDNLRQHLMSGHKSITF